MTAAVDYNAMNAPVQVESAALLARLRDRITPPERAALEADAVTGISRYNRSTLLRMLTEPAPPHKVELSRVEALEKALKDYLNREMPEAPDGHKWIVLSCLYLAFVVREPMHPRVFVKWRRTEDGYACPAFDAHGVCRWCVCRAERAEDARRNQ